MLTDNAVLVQVKLALLKTKFQLNRSGTLPSEAGTWNHVSASVAETGETMDILQRDLWLAANGALQAALQALCSIASGDVDGGKWWQPVESAADDDDDDEA